MGGPRGGGARADTGSATTSRASGANTRRPSGAGSANAGGTSMTDAALSRRPPATPPEARSNRSQQSRDLILSSHPACAGLCVLLACGQQHLSINRPMLWQKYWTPPAACSGSVTSNTARTGKSRARIAAITIDFIRPKDPGIQLRLARFA